jgi:hypothetical protein
MEPSIPLPTDNIYKFVALFGLDFGHLPCNQLAGKWQPHEGFIAAA